jgi:hypothetical protein
MTTKTILDRNEMSSSSSSFPMKRSRSRRFSEGKANFTLELAAVFQFVGLTFKTGRNLLIISGDELGFRPRTQFWEDIQFGQTQP